MDEIAVKQHSYAQKFREDGSLSSCVEGMRPKLLCPLSLLIYFKVLLLCLEIEST